MRRTRKALTALVSSGALVAAGLVTTAVTATVLTTAPPAAAVDDGLADLPPMGFNDWNAFGCDVDEQLIKQTADTSSRAQRPQGRRLPVRQHRRLLVDRTSATRDRSPGPGPGQVPDGIDGVADYVHGKGLKLGIYGDAGTKTCAGYPGSLGHERWTRRPSPTGASTT